MGKLYHGTTAAVAIKAIEDGLKPRSETDSEGNWEEVPSIDEHVYLTTAYAGYFAAMAQLNEDEPDEWGLVEVDTDLLTLDRLLPDEDYLEQSTRNATIPDEPQYAELVLCETMEKRTAWFREHIWGWQHTWQKSIQGLGNCAHYGIIPPDAITRVATFNPKSNQMIALMTLDPSISVLNYLIMKQKYQALTQWLMGYHVNSDDLLGGTTTMEQLEEYAKTSEGWAKQLEIRHQQIEKMEERDGITVHYSTSDEEPGESEWDSAEDSPST